jgi:hypothetical protein
MLVGCQHMLVGCLHSYVDTVLHADGAKALKSVERPDCDTTKFASNVMPEINGPTLAPCTSPLATQTSVQPAVAPHTPNVVHTTLQHSEFAMCSWWVGTLRFNIHNDFVQVPQILVYPVLK